MDKELVDAIRQVVREEVSGIKGNVSGLKDDVKHIKDQVKENARLLRALEHNSEVHKAEIENLKLEIAKVAGNEEKIKKLKRDFEQHEHDITLKAKKTTIS
jgi:chromosome segregation ATPase